MGAHIGEPSDQKDLLPAELIILGEWFLFFFFSFLFLFLLFSIQFLLFSPLFSLSLSLFHQVNRSARVAGASKGGQIVVSKQLLDSAEFDQDQFITEDLGMFSLKVFFLLFFDFLIF